MEQLNLKFTFNKNDLNHTKNITTLVREGWDIVHITKREDGADSNYEIVLIRNFN